LLHEADLVLHGAEGTGLFSIEHVEPQSAAPGSANAYSNCVYACRYCNRERSTKPTKDALGRTLLDPTVVAWGTHFTANNDRLVPNVGDQDAAYTEVGYGMNKPRKLTMRQNRRESISYSRKVLAEGPASVSALTTLAQRLASSPEPASHEEAAGLMDTARQLREAMARARASLEQYAGIPRDADHPCHCSVKRELPIQSESQMRDL
jgi:hypothetical protein